MGAETIVAVSTPAGRGGIGIVRVSGPLTATIIDAVAVRRPQPRGVCYTAFNDTTGQILDHGLILWFPAPNSYTGDDLAEFHAHGNPIILQALIAAACHAGARPARPGEFTERAYRNGKIDLAQAEAVADLIASQTLRAARSAERALSGAFGREVLAIIERIQLARAMLEATIDFADDLHAEALQSRQLADLATISHMLEALLQRARQGTRLTSGATLAIAGRPNVGKSSILNFLAEHDRAIVSDIPGTTRDTVHVDIVLEDVPIRLIDTAGLHTTDDPLELEGIRRSRAAVAVADLLLLVVDDACADFTDDAIAADLQVDRARICVHNKIDRSGHDPGIEIEHGQLHAYVSAHTGAGMDELVRQMLLALGVETESETEFTARGRHLEALMQALATLSAIDPRMLEHQPELVAEHYRAATVALETISGRYSSEDLLGDIFARFCIGK